MSHEECDRNFARITVAVRIINCQMAPVVIMRSVNVGGDDGGEVASVLLVVALVHHIDHPLRIGIARV